MNVESGMKRNDLWAAKRIAALMDLGMTLGLASCGGGGGDSPFDDRTDSADQYAAQCAAPRSGNDPYNGNQPYPDKHGSIDIEKQWVHAYMNDVYLWYKDIPSVNAGAYTVSKYGTVMDALDAYFQALKTPKKTASGKLVDEFSFTYPTDAWNALSESGVFVSYGMQFAVVNDQTSPPRDFRIAYTEPDRPASNANAARGAKILAIDGADMVNGDDVDTLNAGLSPSTEGEKHTFKLQDIDGTVHTETFTAAAVTETPVQNVKTLAGGQVGYLLFNDHIATAEGELINAIKQLQTAAVSDLVIDIRYNGGGYLDIASELAYMIAGGSRTSGKAFETLSFNDKSPYNGSADATTDFHSKAVGFDSSVTAGSALPTLNLGRVYVLVGPGTCSASEAIINGLEGVNVQVVTVGGTTCGKPYGFFPTDNCGLTYFAIEFKGVNDKGFGDYADGFDADCEVADDFTHALGDPNESLLATALSYRSNGKCPASSKAASTAAPLKLLRSPAREIRILRRQ